MVFHEVRDAHAGRSTHTGSTVNKRTTAFVTGGFDLVGAFVEVGTDGALRSVLDVYLPRLYARKVGHWNFFCAVDDELDLFAMQFVLRDCSCCT